MKLVKLIGAAAILLMTACGGLDGVPNTPSNSDMAGEKSGGDMTEAASGGGDMSLLPLFATCMTSNQCGSGLCTMASYDRLTMPICTYQCDANDMNPKCPLGCNPKGYCKIQM